MCTLYVDDLIVTSNNPLAIAQFKTYLGWYFHMKDLSFLKYFLGIEMARILSRLYLTQGKYVRNIISETILSSSKRASTPI